MNKLLLAIAMLCSVAISATENITGIWYDKEDGGEYYIVILNNKEEGYKFVNFSFKEQDTVNETLLAEEKNTIWTRITNDDNDWDVICKYSYIDKNTLKVTYEGDYNGTDYLKRKKIK
jgi:carboxypeptidase C (cathepsin A)